MGRGASDRTDGIDGVMRLPCVRLALCRTRPIFGARGDVHLWQCARANRQETCDTSFFISTHQLYAPHCSMHSSLMLCT